MPAQNPDHKNTIFISICASVIAMVYLGEQLGDHLTDVLSPLGDVGVEAVQVGAEAQRDDLEDVWRGHRRGEGLGFT